MPVSFANLEVGQEFERPELAEMWGYQGFQAIARGAVTPKDTNFIILFITKEKQEALTQYQDNFEDGVLEIEGETNHTADNRIVHADEKGDEIHLFYRERHHSPFVYHGQVYLTDFTLFTDKPSHFRFANDRETQSIDGALEAESLAHGVSLEDYVPDPEGRKRIIQSIQYERSAKNRKRALKIHGNACLVCGFAFDAFYGADLAVGFIEVHHTRSITEIEGSGLDIETDLASVCSNCHSMLHKRRDEIMPIAELKQRVEQAGGHQPPTRHEST
jgi:5-methylcytosine-specific restriction enzyme A